MEEPGGLVDSIYECAMLPELWPGVLDRLAGIAGARSGLVFAVSRQVTSWTAAEVGRENMPVAAPQAPAADLVQSLFDLTPAEARVARGLASGDTVDDIAAKGGVSVNTVKTQVRAVLGKTGLRRQTDVMALLSGLRTPF